MEDHFKSHFQSDNNEQFQLTQELPSYKFLWLQNPVLNFLNLLSNWVLPPYEHFLVKERALILVASVYTHTEFK